MSEPTEELTVSFTTSYDKTLKKHHNLIVKGMFSLAMKACPYRVDFYNKLGDDQGAVGAHLDEWIAALERIVQGLFAFLKEKNVS